MLGADWKVFVLDNVRGSSDNIFNYITNEELPKGYFKLDDNNSDEARIKADIVRILLLQKYGGIWVDGSVVMIRHLDHFCYGEF